MKPFPAFADLPKRGRRPNQEQAIVKGLKEDMFTGTLAPGDRLPLRTEIERRFNAASNTVQRAMSILAHDGFIEAKGKRGTFVADLPPYLNRFGMVWSSDPMEPNLWPHANYFSTFLYRDAVALQQKGRHQLVHYMGVDGHTDREGSRRLLKDVAEQRLAGLIFDTPTCLYRSPFYELLDTPHLPCVLLNEDFNNPNVIHLMLYPAEVVDRALDYLQAGGRRRIALLTLNAPVDVYAHFTRAVEERGLETRPFWIQGSSAGSLSARHSMNLLMRARETPDALIIADDSLVEQATAGLLDAGVSDPKRLMVVAHANFPHATPSAVPARRVGLHVPGVLAIACEAIVKRRQGKRVPKTLRIPTVWEDEAGRGKREA
jgi:DNA-binding LacI/PurR family transcriptional regulator